MSTPQDNLPPQQQLAIEIEGRPADAPVTVESPLPKEPSIGERLDAQLRNALDFGFKLAVRYGNNHHHFDGAQKERHYEAFVKHFRPFNLLDPAICRLQLPDGSVPGDILECAQGWQMAFTSFETKSRDQAAAMLASETKLSNEIDSLTEAYRGQIRELQERLAGARAGRDDAKAAYERLRADTSATIANLERQLNESDNAGEALMSSVAHGQGLNASLAEDATAMQWLDDLGKKGGDNELARSFDAVNREAELEGVRFIMIAIPYKADRKASSIREAIKLAMASKGVTNEPVKCTHVNVTRVENGTFCHGCGVEMKLVPRENDGPLWVPVAEGSK